MTPKLPLTEILPVAGRELHIKETEKKPHYIWLNHYQCASIIIQELTPLNYEHLVTYVISLPCTN
jgi:hypothetical protein